MPKKNGGRSIRSCKLWNVALVGKLVWQLACKTDSLRIKWVHGLYMKGNQGIWTHTLPGDSSWYWRKINSIKMAVTERYNNGTYCLIDNGAYFVNKSYNNLLGRLEEPNCIARKEV